jgi:hypothetical protein
MSLADEGMTKVFYLDGKQINSKETFLDKVAMAERPPLVIAMQFPEHFGANWDAFDEYITDLNWCPSEKYMVYQNDEIFAQADLAQ